MNSSVIKLLVAAVGGYFLYEYLKSSGLWGEWFGFSDTASLAAYCGANPTATATYNGQAATCQQWAQALTAAAQPASTATAPAATTVATTSTPPATSAPAAIDQNLANQLTAGMQQKQGRTVGTISEWNWVLQNMVNANASIITSTTQYGNQQITAVQYLQQKAALGLSGLGYPRVISAWDQRYVF